MDLGLADGEAHSCCLSYASEDAYLATRYDTLQCDYMCSVVECLFSET